MEGSDGSECSKAWPSDHNEDEEESDINDKRIMASDHGSGSSSNSTIEENDQKKSSSTVRPYVRSKTPRLRWTQDLHQRFAQAVERLGGQERATPKLVLQLMNVKGLNIAHIKSHLQMYRSKKIDDPSQVISDYRNFVDGGDWNVYNLSQLPMLQSYNQTYNQCSLRYGEIAPWNVGLQKRMQSSFMSRTALENVRPTFYSSVSERIFGRNQMNRDAHVDHSSSSEFSTWKTHDRKFGLGGSIHNLERRQQDHKSLINPMELSSFIKVEATVPQPPLLLEATNLQKHTTTAKRKVSTCDLDLNLTLGVKSRNDDDDDDDDDDNDDDNWEARQQWVDENKTLSLSLYLQSSSKKVRRWKEVDMKEDGGRPSTLDLTL